MLEHAMHVHRHFLTCTQEKTVTCSILQRLLEFTLSQVQRNNTSICICTISYTQENIAI